MFDTIEEIKRFRDNAPANADAIEVANLYANKGKKIAMDRLNEISRTKKLMLWETRVLADRVRNILINNNINLR